MRPVIMLLGLAILLANTGDCVNLAFADAKAADCCLRADCPLAGAPQMDSCCKGLLASGQYIQAAPQRSISQPSVKDIEFPVEAVVGQIIVRVGNSSLDRKFQSPPGPLNTLSTPLLI